MRSRKVQNVTECSGERASTGAIVRERRPFIRCLSLLFWWGASAFVIWKWRKALGVSRTDNEGTRRRMRVCLEHGGRHLGGPPGTKPRARRACSACAR